MNNQEHEKLMITYESLSLLEAIHLLKTCDGYFDARGCVVLEGI